MRILVTDGMDRTAVEMLSNDGHTVVEQFYDQAELGSALRDFDVVIIRSKTKIQANHIEMCRNGALKLIIRAGVGIDNIDVTAAKAAGISVFNTPNASSQSVAELALGHMLACSRYMSVAGYSMREGKWEKKAFGKGIELSGKTLGIIGFGRIGQKLGSIAQALGMKVLAFSRTPHYELEEQMGITYVSLDTLFTRSDFISIHTPAVDAVPLVNADTIAQMKDGVVIINTSRGCNIQEDALLEALNSGKVRAAGLDVFEDEPTANAELCAHPHVSCTPHIGAATIEAQTRIGVEIVDIIRKFTVDA